MREIKFRAWDTYDKKMIDWWEIKYRKFASFGNMVWRFMQFTGLTDKNGNDIYEGDIVKRITYKYNYDDPNDIYKQTDIEERSYIEYNHHGFWVHDESFGWEGENLWNWDEIEIIGNVHEHPELVQQSKSI